MEITATPSRQIDTGLIGLVMLARFYGKAAEPEQIRHQFGAHGKAFDSTDILRAARSLDLKAREVTSSWERLAKTPMPALALRTDGRYVVIGAAKADEVLLQDPTEDRPKTLSREEFAGIWTGRLILFATRGFLNNIAGKVRSVLVHPGLVKYRKQFGEVIAASFFLQFLALDHAAVLPGDHRQGAGAQRPDHAGRAGHRPADGGVLRGDARRLAHLSVLAHHQSRGRGAGRQAVPPSAAPADLFFQSRPVGTVVARVRELETVRSFITGSALTVASTPYSRSVFFAVMYFYSATLFWIVFATIPLAALSLLSSRRSCAAAGRQVRAHRREPGVPGES